MSLLFGVANTDRVSLGVLPSGLSNIDPVSVEAWIYPTSFGGSDYIINFDDLRPGFVVGASGVLQLFVRRTSVSTNYITATGFITLNQWQYVAGRFDSSAAGNACAIYRGTLKDPCVEASSYTTSANGSGTINGIGAESHMVGHDSFEGAGNSFHGLIGMVRVYQKALTLHEIRAHQSTRGWWPLLRGAWELGRTGRSARELDYSRVRTPGVVTGATVARSIPIHYWPARRPAVLFASIPVAATLGIRPQSGLLRPAPFRPGLAR